MPVPSREVIKQDLLQVLSRGGALTINEIYAELAQIWRLTATELAVRRSKGLFYQHEIRWARQELAIAGIIKRPKESGRGNWRLVNARQIPPDDYDDEGEDFEEGLSKRITVNSYERNKEARRKCLEKHGFSCVVCGFNFEKAYGATGRGCIHVHHLIEISSIKIKRKVSPTKDLLPVCPNCHYLIHRRKPAYTIDEVRSMLTQQ